MRNITVTVFIVAIVFITGCFPTKQPPYSQAFVPPQNLKTLKKVLIIGPDTSMKIKVIGVPDILINFDETAAKEIQTAWQAAMVEQWTEFKGKDAAFFDLMPSDASQSSKLDKLIKSIEVSRFDTKTGQINKDYLNQLRAVYGKFAQQEDVDAVLHTLFTTRIIEKGFVSCWDGTCDGVEDPGYYKDAELPAISLSTELIDKNGQLLMESRAGYVRIQPSLLRLELSAMTTKMGTVLLKANKFQNGEKIRKYTSQLALGEIAKPNSER